MTEEIMEQHIKALSEITIVDLDMWTTFDSLYRAYARHIRRKSLEPLEEGGFVRVMIDLGFDYDLDRLPSGRAVWYGIGLLSNRTEPYQLSDIESCFYVPDIKGGHGAHETAGKDDETEGQWFDLFLKGNVESSKDVAIRDADLYGAMKEYCRSKGIKSPTWPEYHALLKERGAQKRPLVKQMMIWGIQWKKNAQYRPSGSVAYSATSG